MRFDGELNNSFGLPLAPSVINTCHEITEGQPPFPLLGFHSQIMVNFHYTILPPS